MVYMLTSLSSVPFLHCQSHEQKLLTLCTRHDCSKDITAALVVLLKRSPCPVTQCMDALHTLAACQGWNCLHVIRVCYHHRAGTKKSVNKAVMHEHKLLCV